MQRQLCGYVGIGEFDCTGIVSIIIIYCHDSLKFILLNVGLLL